MSNTTLKSIKDMIKCKKCDLEFSSEERLERHIVKAHGKLSKSQIKRDTYN